MNSKKITRILIASSLSFLGLYIYLTSSISAIGYEIEDASKSLLGLKEQKSNLVVSLSQNKTSDFLISESEPLNLVKVEASTRFIDARNSSLGQALR